ncbi:hypothetical protein H8E06_00240 [bacterium]|nr:hypothetical protein [bacterium]
MTSFVDIRVGDFLYVRFPDHKKDTRIIITDIRGDDMIAGETYDTSLRKYIQRVVKLEWITGIRLLSREDIPTSRSVTLLYEIL